MVGSSEEGEDTAGPGEGDLRPADEHDLGESALAAELSSLGGARIDAAHACPETGLIALVFYAGEKRILGVGIGPEVAGVGWLPRLPRVRASSSHPLVAAMRAHLVDHRAEGAGVGSDGTLWVDAEGPPGRAARLLVMPGRRGEACVISAAGDLVMRWPPSSAERGGEATAREPSVATPRPAKAPPRDLEAAGVALVEESDRRSALRVKTALARSVKARVHALERRAEAVRGDLTRLGGIDHLQKIGRLLLAQGSRVPRGAARATLDDWEAGGTIDVTLDPARPAKAQAEGYFAKARRYQRGEAIMRRRLAETEASLSDLRALSAAVAAVPAGELEALTALSAQARSLGVSDAPEAPSVATGRAARAAERKPYTLFRSAMGQPILVGRGAKDNDELTTRHARPHDLWLHAKGILGAHVVVPLEKGTTCPADLLVDAATLAAHFSDARGEAVCEVSYVERRYVRKPRKSAPGAVTFDREKVLALRVEPARLERLLASKEAP